MKKVVLITGASKGIGAATAKKFAENGFAVAINYNKSKLEAQQVAEFINKNGGIAKIFQCDISKFEKLEKLVEQVEKEFGRIDVLVNNAGIAIDKEFNKKTILDWQKTFNTNLFSCFELSKIIAEKMYAKKSGNIINVASTSAYYLNPTSADYDASKAALITLSKNLACNYQPYVRVNSVSPGWVKTDINKDLGDAFEKETSQDIYLKRWGKPEEIANVIFFLASDQSSYINGTDIIVDGGEN